jgi:hypothetical protein
MAKRELTIDEVMERRAWPYGRVSLRDFLFGGASAYTGNGRRRKHKRNRQGDCSRAWGLRG